MPKTLLLADDSVTIQKVVGITFANEDVELVTVDNGDDALVRAREVQPDVVLADVSMPGLNGYALCAELKRDPALQGVPVLLLTGTFEPFDEQRAIEVGADAHISKPFEAQALVDRVRTLLERGPELLPAPLEDAPPSLEAGPAPLEAGPPPLEASPAPLEAALPSPPASPALEPEFDPLPVLAGADRVAPPPSSPFEGTELDSPAATLEPESPDTAPAQVPGLQFGPPAAGWEPEGPDETRIFSGDMLRSEEAPLPAELEPPREGAAFAREPLGLDSGDDPLTAPLEEESFDRSLLNETSFLDPTRSTGPSGADTAPTPLLGQETGEGRSSWDAPEEDLFESDSPDSAREAMLHAPVAEGEPPAPVLDPPGEPVPPRSLEMTMVMPSGNDPTEPELEPLPEPIEASADTAADELDAALSPADEELPWLEPVPLEAADAEDAAAEGGGVASVDAAQLRESLERVAWEAFGPLSEQLVREVVKKVEEIAWEVVPQLTEQLIREEIARLKGESD
jgi:CheY-like chemotaxis protein